LNELALFAGAGGGILGGKLLGWTTVCAVEYNAYARSVLLARQNDGTLAPFPIWDDVRTFDGKPWRGIVDVVSGGFPCQDISVAGKGAGIAGERSGLWTEMARIVREVRPRYTFIENSPMLVSRGLDRVLCDLAALGFDAKWGVIGAGDVGAPHLRKRIWIVGFNPNQSNASGEQPTSRSHKDSEQRTAKENQQKGNGWKSELGAVDVAQRFSSYADALRILHGMAHRSDRLAALGNGQVPRVAATAWNLLKC
jgi:DNA (cytosine-5)-methyltransferase 1